MGERERQIRERLEAFPQATVGVSRDEQYGGWPTFRYHTMDDPRDPLAVGRVATAIEHAPDDIRYLLDRVDALEQRNREALEVALFRELVGLRFNKGRDHPDGPHFGGCPGCGSEELSTQELEAMIARAVHNALLDSADKGENDG